MSDARVERLPAYALGSLCLVAAAMSFGPGALPDWVAVTLIGISAAITGKLGYAAIRCGAPEDGNTVRDFLDLHTALVEPTIVNSVYYELAHSRTTLSSEQIYLKLREGQADGKPVSAEAVDCALATLIKRFQAGCVTGRRHRTFYAR